MITATVKEICDAYRAFCRIGEVRLPPKAAWRVSRILSKLKLVVIDFEETQKKLFLDIGGELTTTGVQILPIERNKNENDEDWNKRLAKQRETLIKLNADMTALNKEEVKIDYDPIPLSLFNGHDEKNIFIAPCDFADAGQFIQDDK